MTCYRIFVADSGLFRDITGYTYVAEFADQKSAAFYVRHMFGKARYAGKDIIMKKVEADAVNPGEGDAEGVLLVNGEALPPDELTF
ncbi:MAG: hypothetical protein K6C08_03135 [Oscillospiraceae bacterium]|nr:hypothetical protein [Oscillospiraceae bacterium]